jgi:hypothetical protein
LDWRQRLFRQPAKQVRDGRHGGKKGLAPKVVSAARGAGLGRLPQVAERGSLQRPFRRLARQVLRCCLLGGFRNTPGRLLRQQARHARKAVRMGLWSSSVEEVGSVHQGTRRARRCPLLVAAASTRDTEKPSERVSARTGRRPAERQGKPQPATATPRGCHRRRQNRRLRVRPARRLALLAKKPFGVEMQAAKARGMWMAQGCEASTISVALSVARLRLRP